MTRVEDCTKTIAEVNEGIETLSNKVKEGGFSVVPEVFLLGCFEMAKVSRLMMIKYMDAAQSLAILADGLSDDE